jgi:hypothetical protein
MIMLNITYDLLQTTKNSSSTISFEMQQHTDSYPIGGIVQRTTQTYFVICNSCYWCASFFGIDNLKSLSASPSHSLCCFACNSRNTELIPISTDESFRINYNITRGLEIEFYKSSNIPIRHKSLNE